MMRTKMMKKSVWTGVVITSMVLLLTLSQMGCATKGQTIASGMLAGAVVGAGVGHQFVHHGPDKRYEKENTVITSVVFALAAGGALAWHYRELERTKVEISGRFARYRLCDVEEMQAELARQLEFGHTSEGRVFALKDEQVGRLAISLDDHTKWVYPTFRQRFLLPELGETQVVSERYIWEIIRPGRFVTRAQNPQFFLSFDGAPEEASEPGQHEDEKGNED